MIPTVRKRKDVWVTTFGDYPKSFSSMAFKTWDEAMAAALRGGGKNPLSAVWSEWQRKAAGL